MASFSFSPNWSYYPLNGNQLPIINPDAISGNFTISIAPHWYDRANLTWTVPSDWGSITFNVFAAPTESGPFTQLNSTPLASPQFVDLKLESYSKGGRKFYIVEATFPNGKRVQSPATTWENKGTTFVNLRIKEIQRREWLLLRKFVGVETLLLRRKTYGIRCPNCYNEDTKRVNNDRCTICWGVSWVGGYHSPLSTLMQYDPTPDEVVLGYAGKLEPNQITAWTIAFPEILDLDLIYRIPDKRLYRVDKVNPTELTTKPVRQIALITELSKESIEYKLVQNL